MFRPGRVCTRVDYSGGYPSGQRGQTVNLVALPSQVRILLHPCQLRVGWNGSESDAFGRELTGGQASNQQGGSSPGRLEIGIKSTLYSGPVGVPAAVADQGYPRRESWLDADENCGCNSMVEYLPSKQATWVRFPSPALRERRQPGCGEEYEALHRENVNRGFDLASGNAANTADRRRVFLLLGDVAGKGCRGSVGRARPW